MTIDLETLNNQYAIGQHVTFVEGPGGLPLAEIRNGLASATVALHGGHVIAFQPHGQQPVLFLSSSAVFAHGKAIRGGIPICWPWFADHPTDPSKPKHGFVRTRMWYVAGTAVIGDATQLRLGIVDDEATREIWPYTFELELIVTVGARLDVELIARNPGNEPFQSGGALHTYFHAGDVTRVQIHGLEGTRYIDTVGVHTEKVQHGPITFAGETDRIYLDTTADCVIEQPILERRVRVAKDGSRTTVVWNPWVERASALPDMSSEEYLQMVCVETANANIAGDAIEVPPGAEHHLRASIGVEP